MAPHSSTLAWRIPLTEEPGVLQSMGSLRVDTTVRLHFHFSHSCIGEGNGNPLQCSCLENPRDGGAWLAAVYGVAQSRTRLKRLSSSSSITEYWTEFPVVHSRSLLVIYFIYSSIYMSVPISLFIPPPLYLLVAVSLFSTSVNQFLFCR